MPHIKPFHAIRYDAESLNMAQIVSPPYDVISPELQNELYRRHSFNAVRLELPKEENGYEQAAERFSQWQAQNILLRDPQPGLYLYEQTYVNAHGVKTTRRGFFCLLELEEFEKGNVLPHERTLSGPKEDRLKILRAVRANLSPVFALYAGAPADITSRLEQVSVKTLVDVVGDHGERNVLRQCVDERSIEFVVSALQDAKIYIADGHHRYETALAYRDEMRRAFPGASPDAPWNFILVYLSDINDPALEIQPTHRLVHSLVNFQREEFERKLAEVFDVTHCESFEAGNTALQKKGSDTILFAYPDSPQLTMAVLKQDLNNEKLYGESVPSVLRDLSIEILHVIVLRNILGLTEAMQLKKLNLEYVHTLQEVKIALATGRFQFGAILNPTTLAQLRSAAEAKVVLPQKSTYFYPKLLSGLVFHRFE
jgi:uncharacterized protein (DUF1015 family)